MLRGSRTKFLRRNRRLLQQKQATYFPGSSHSPPRLLTAAELEEATGSYHPDNMIKRDGSYELYRGTIGGQGVSVKRATPPVAINGDIEGLITEIVVLSGVGHRNVVKLLGCCLETEVPALVYELHSHGTLQDRAFAAAGGAGEPLSWPSRLRIAAEVAGGLHYLHCYAPLTIVHRDIRPSTIVLDEQGVPKIVDFSLSVPIPSEAEPGVITEEIDVYSFGMLLVVLMLGEHPRQREDEGGYPLLSLLGCGEQQGARAALREGLVARAGCLGDAEGKVEQLGAFADLAVECVHRRGEERLIMKEVERRLREMMGLTP